VRIQSPFNVSDEVFPRYDVIFRSLSSTLLKLSDGEGYVGSRLASQLYSFAYKLYELSKGSG